MRSYSPRPIILSVMAYCSSTSCRPANMPIARSGVLTRAGTDFAAEVARRRSPRERYHRGSGGGISMWHDAVTGPG